MSETLADHCDQSTSQGIPPPEVHTDSATEFLDSPQAISSQRGGRRKSVRQPRSHQQDHWAELQALRGKLAEQEETMGKLKAAFGMIALALDIQQPRVTVDPFGHSVHDTASGSHAFQMDTPANRPPRMSRGGGVNCVNTSHYKNTNRGGGQNSGFRRGFRASVGNFPGFRDTEW